MRVAMIGTTLGHYRIERALGSGGMGDVYLAEDLVLHRKVALKTLGQRLASDPEALPRFKREAQAVAALNHPSIVTIHSVEEADGVHFITMEVVEGRTLSQVIPSGGLALPESLDIAIRLAHAVDAAHRRGIVHRDLKPGNVMVTQSGIKILDFGLAKLEAAPGEESQLSTLTASGLIVGTPQYMAPEQLEGRAVDHRADVFALGALLYQMLTGRLAFEGSSPASVMAAVLTHEPAPISRTRLEVPPLLDTIVKKCLAKNPDERWQSVRDLGDAFRWVRDGGAVARPAADAAPRTLTSRKWLFALAALLLGVALGVGSMLMAPRSRPDVPDWARTPVRFALSGAGLRSQLALTRDGRQLAFVAPGPDGATAIWVQALDESMPRMLAGTSGAVRPFWSPDGRSIAFHANNALKRIDVSGGAAQTLCPAAVGIAGGTWSSTGTIIFALQQVLHQIPATGGTPTPVTKLDLSRQENAHRFPTFLPDGKRFLFVARSGRPEKSSVYLGSLEGTLPSRLFTTLSPVAYAAPGHLIFAREGTLVAQPFDEATGRLSGQSSVIATGVGGDPWNLSAEFTVAGGVLAYGALEMPRSQLTWFDRTGRTAGTIGEPNRYSYFRISPDGSQVAVDVADQQLGSRSVWLLHPATGGQRRLTFAGSHDWIPVWSPDGAHVLFSSWRDGPSNLYRKSVAGSAADETVLASSEQKFGHDWSPDGQFVAYMTSEQGRESDIYVRRVDRSGEPIAIATTAALEYYPRFSPDGHWIAYGSGESGVNEVYVQPFPPTGGKWQISSGGGTQIRWNRHGTELFYLTRDNRLMAVDVRTVPSFSVRAGPPRVLFQVANAHPAGSSNTYEVARDGRFLFNVRQPAAIDGRVNVVLNWAAGLPH